MADATREFYAVKTKAKEAAAARKVRGETLTRAEEGDLNYRIPPEQTFEDFVKTGPNRELFARFGTDTTAYGRYYDENHDYLYSVAPFCKIIVDEDVKSLGIPNTDHRVLVKAIELWETGRTSRRPGASWTAIRCSTTRLRSNGARGTTRTSHASSSRRPAASCSW